MENTLTLRFCRKALVRFKKVCMCVCGQTGVYECKASISCLLHHVWQRSIDIDESKLDGDSVHPVRCLIVMAAILLIIPSSLRLSLSPSVGLSVSVSAVSFPKNPKADERSPLWHMTHTLLSFEFFHLTDPSATSPHPSTHPYLPTHMHPCTHPHTPSCLSSLAPRRDRPWRNSCCVTQ